MNFLPKTNTYQEDTLKKQIFILLLVFLLFLVGLGLAAYPMISSYDTQRHQSQVYTQYQELVEKADGEELDTAGRPR